MIAENAENAIQVCDPVACAEALRKILYLLRLAARPGSDIAAAAINMLHGNLPRRGTLVPEMRVRNRPGPVPPIPIQPDGWVGTPIRFGGNRAPSAAFAAIWGLQQILLVLPDAALPKDDAAWQDYPWVRILRTDPFLAFDRGSLADLYEQAEDLLVAVQIEATQRAVAAAPVEPAKRTHSTDFTTAEWDGTKYTFSPLQADAVKALWQEYETTGFGLHQNAIRESLDHERGNFRVPHVFRKHPAYGVMIHSCGRGKYRLGKPDAITKTKTKTPSKKPVKAKAAATVPPVSSNGLSPLGMRAKQKIEAEYAAAHPED